MNISKEQVAALTKLSPKERYEHSIKMIADREELFSLLDGEGNWVIAEVENKGTFFLWSAEEYATPLMSNSNWKDCKLESITLDEFQDEIIEFLKENKILINVFSTDNLSGFVVSADEFVRDLDIELESYD